LIVTTNGEPSILLYQWYELNHAAVRPARAAAGTYHAVLTNPFNPLAHSQLGQHAAAACEVFERTTRRYEKPEFAISEIEIDGVSVSVTEKVVWQKPFCRLIHFQRDLPQRANQKDPRVLLVAPMSGHFATLLRGTVETLLPDHDVYITDWSDARCVPIYEGRFDLDDYIDYVMEMMHHFQGDVHVIGVCQPSVPVLAAISRLEADNDVHAPWSMTLIGGPIDTRINPTAVNKVAEARTLDWFRNTVITHVPWQLPGAGRSVYPGFTQLSGFMSMNLDRHTRAHHEFFDHLVEGDGDSAEKHRAFYDEYLAVMDLTAEFYLQTIDTVFMRHALPEGTMHHRGEAVDPGHIERVALMTIEGEKDDITGVGQCSAAHDLCNNLPENARYRYVAPGVGHYGLFNGTKFRTDIAPRIAQFVRRHDPKWDDTNGSLLKKFKRVASSSKTINPKPTDQGEKLAHSQTARSSGTASTPSTKEFVDDSPLQTVMKLWHISNDTMFKSAVRMCTHTSSSGSAQQKKTKVSDS